MQKLDVPHLIENELFSWLNSQDCLWKILNYKRTLLPVLFIIYCYLKRIFKLTTMAIKETKGIFWNTTEKQLKKFVPKDRLQWDKQKVWNGGLLHSSKIWAYSQRLVLQMSISCHFSKNSIFWSRHNTWAGLSSFVWSLFFSTLYSMFISVKGERGTSVWPGVAHASKTITKVATSILMLLSEWWS